MLRQNARAPAMLAVLAFLLGAGGTVPARTTQQSGSWDLIAFEVKSWGQPVTSWRLLADGSGSWTEAVHDEGAPPNVYRVVWHEFASGEDGYRQVETILSWLPDPIPDYNDCTNRMTDLPYGTLRLTRGATTIEVAWNSGCMDDGYRTLLETLKAADSAVATWGRAGRVRRPEKPDTSAASP